MPDPYAQITDADPAVLDVLIDAMELRAADPRQRAVRKAFLSKVDLPDGARVLEAGCGSGAVCRELALHPEVSEVVGLDPSPVFLEKARELAAAVPICASMRAMLGRCRMKTANSMPWSSTRSISRATRATATCKRRTRTTC